MPASLTHSYIDDAKELPFVVDTADARDLDEAFSFFVSRAMKNFSEPTVIETSAANFEVRVPKSLCACPMWAVWLPDTFARQVDEFAHFLPRVWELTSIDLLKRRTTLEWESSTHCVCVDLLNVTASLGWASDNDSRIVVAFVTPSRTALCTLRVDEELMLDLQIRGARCDYNYRPVREYTEEELSAAAACSVIIGNEPTEHDFGKVPVHPIGKRYQYCQPSEFERASLYD